MIRKLVVHPVAAAVALAFSSIVAAQTPASPAGQQGILIGRQPAAASKDAIKDAHKDSAHKGAVGANMRGVPGATTNPAGARRNGAQAMGGQDPSQGGTGGQKRTLTRGAQMDPGQAGSGVQNPANAQARGGQDGSGMQNPKGVQVRGGQDGSGVQNPANVQARGGAAGSPAMQGRSSALQSSGALSGQPNPAATNAAKGLR